MERLENIFGNKQREVGIAKRILGTLRPLEAPIDLIELIKQCGNSLREVEEKHKSPHPVDYNRIFEQLGRYGYINPST